MGETHTHLGMSSKTKGAKRVIFLAAALDVHPAVQGEMHEECSEGSVKTCGTGNRGL